MLKKIYLLLSLVFVSNLLFSQFQEFTPDTTKYLKEVEKFLSIHDKQDAKKFVEDEFHPVWSSDAFTEDKKQIVYATSNMLMQMRVEAVPGFKNYLVAAMNAVKYGQSFESFKTWHKILGQVADSRNKREFAAYLQGSAELFSDNIVFRSASTTWQSSSSDYEFDFERVPIIRFKNLDLKCYSKGDSAVIYGTKGVYYPFTSRWEGLGGKVTWERCGIDDNKLFALVNEYDISMKSAGFSADSVELYSPYFLEPIKGKVIDRARSQYSNRDPIYPQFNSYDNRLVIKNIFPEIDYDGGFSLEGPNLVGRGTTDELAMIKFYRNSQLFAKASSITFTINDESVRAQSARMTIYLSEDSITHPGVNFSYINKDLKLTFLREGEGIGESPFFNSYHGLDMFFESLEWKKDLPYLTCGPLYGNTDKTALFESALFFDRQRYDALTTRDGNPLTIIRNIQQELDTNVFELRYFAGKMNATKEGILGLTYHLSNSGFIYYDSESETIHVKERLHNYIQQRVKKQDYDNIQISSDTKKEYNAIIDLENLDLKLNGVKRINLSDPNFTMIYPDNQELVVKKNRNMLFNGIVNSGRAEYFGKDFYFDYKEFVVDMPACDSMRIRPMPEKEVEKPMRLLSKIEDITGVLYIDDPENKSGQDTSKHMYPIFKSDKETYVYYDDRNIQSGAYDREKFKFVIEPFEMDSLLTFKDEALAFDGTLISAGIFPDIKESLSIQEDYSLGFIKKSPSNGYSIYGGKANYTNDVKLSHEGLKGDGEINFLTSNAKSTDMTFLPEAIVAIAEEYTNKAQTSTPEVPSVVGENVEVVYHPYDDKLMASSIKKELQFFDEDVKLKGELTLTPNGMTGAGTMAFEQAELLAERFEYSLKKVEADTSAFSLINQEGKGFSFQTENVNAHVDFDGRFGDFKLNGENEPIKFPENQYICYMEEFKWWMDQDELELKSSERQDATIETDLDIDQPNFFSVHPKQDSLAFRSLMAKYNLKDKEIKCEKVDYITVADARISPAKGKVTIKKKAEMETLKDASILANTITKHHLMYKATVNIEGKKDYVASGYYKYIDENKREQEVYFANIQPDSLLVTNAKGNILESDKFRLSPNFEYFGEIEMRADVKELTFSGQTRIAHNCTSLPKNWMKFKAQVDPDEIFIPVDGELTDQFDNPLGAGVTLNTDSISIYPTFLSLKKASTHKDIIAANGFLYFDKKTREYQISNKEKIRERSLPGNFVSIHSENCQIQGEGEMSLGAELGQLEVTPYGTMKYSNERRSINANTSILINFPFNDDALDKMAKEIQVYEGLMPLDFSKSTYEKALREILGLEASDNAISELNIKGEIKKIPEELQKSLFLGDVRLVWDNLNNAYRSVGLIGIGNIKKNQIYKYVKGTVEVKKGRNGDSMTIYLELDENTYYFFQYTKGYMFVYSSSADFNKIISETKSDKTKYKGRKGVDDFQFLLGTKTKVLQFLNSLE